LKGLPYFTTIIDERAEFIEKIDGVNKKSVFKNSLAESDIKIEKESFIIVATHSHELDYRIVKELVLSGISYKYLGVIASRKKSAAIVLRLKSELGIDEISNFYTPIGLDIGGTAPDEIAISILAEIQSVNYDKSGNCCLRDLEK